MIKILLGISNDLNALNNEIFWIPKQEINPHLIMSGTSGSGKTETLKVICHELTKQQIPLLIFDFHNDFGRFAKNIIDEKSIRMHPLEILKEQKPKDVAYKVSAILKNSFKDLTTIQEGVIRKAICLFYQNSGISDLTKPNDGTYKLKPFWEFKRYFSMVSAEKRTVESIEIKLDILFDYEVFSQSDSASIDFDSLLKSNTVLQLKSAPSDEVKRIISELIISKLIQHSYLYEQTKEIRLYCVLDEAHRMVYPGSPIETLFRESRKYGIGVILASQRASDFSENLLANAGTVITLKCNMIKDAKFIAKNNFGKEERLMNARVGEGCIRFGRLNYFEEIKIIPLNER